MQDYEKPGVFYLGKAIDPTTKKLQDKPLLFESKYLTTHAVILGMTGSGKTGLGIAILEEAAIEGIPALILDPKGDLTNLLLTFPELNPEQFLPWIDPAEAERNGMQPQAYATSVAERWQKGLAEWNEAPERIARLKKGVDWTIYTPASEAGLPLSILSTFSPPPAEIVMDAGAFRDMVLSTTSSLLGLIGIDADPVQSREHILISTIFDQAWRSNQAMDLPAIIQKVQKPPFDKIGVLDLETFFPSKERQTLALRLNNLIASPGFQAWMEGEPLDIQRLLYTPEGKPRHAVLCIAHLQDSERMFFVTMLLNKLVEWMRRQSGTESLKALLYMDEIFGYFPPSAMPPSKRPMMTLLKQARAFGLGIVLSTQNPVDLDYKGLANCGTWFIGKLQTDRDRSKVIEGMKAASNTDAQTEALNAALAACGSRIFMLRSIHLDQITLFQTRWTLSYLKGPLTLPQIQILMAARKALETSVQAAHAGVKTLQGQKPMFPPGIQEYFFPLKTSQRTTICTPRLIGIGKVHFVDAKSKIDIWKECIWTAPASADGATALWEQSESFKQPLDSLEKNTPPDAPIGDVPPGLLNAKNYAEFTKAFANYLYQHQIYEIYHAPVFKMMSKEEESESDFRARISQTLRDKLEQEAANLRTSYEAKINAVTEKMQKAQEKFDQKKAQAGQKKFDTYVSMGTTLLGAIFGRGRITKGTISQAGTSIRKAGQIGKGEQAAAQAEESVQAYQQQINDLQSEMQTEIVKLQASSLQGNVDIEKIEIHPRKSDISVEAIAILWVAK